MLPNRVVSGFLDRLCTLPAQSLAGLVEASVIRQEMGKALRKFTQSEDHAERVVEKLMEAQWRPTGHDIKLASEGIPVQRPNPLQPADPGCQKCSGIGVEIVTRRDGISGAKTCECRTVKA